MISVDRLWLLFIILIASAKANARATQRWYPDIFVLGEIKCGTTSLGGYIQSHPQVCGSHGEIHFFNHNYKKGKTWYDAIFESLNCSDDKLQLDNTPAYTSLRELDRMVEFYGQKELKKKKFILSFRDPASVVLSWYNHHIRECNYTMAKAKRYIDKSLPTSSFSHSYSKSELCDGHHLCSKVGCDRLTLNVTDPFDPTKYLYNFEQFLKYSGRYSEEAYNFLNHLKAWENVVGREQIFVLKFDDLIKNVSTYSGPLAQFLELSEGWSPNQEFPHMNSVNHYIYPDCKTWDVLAERLSFLNAGLEDHITHHPNKPSNEPAFSPFIRKRQCIP